MLFYARLNAYAYVYVDAYDAYDYAMLSLCYAKLMLYHTIPHYTILYHTIPYHTILYYTIPYYTILYYTIPYYVIPYYTIPYYTMLYHTILYHTMLCYATPERGARGGRAWRSGIGARTACAVACYDVYMA